VTATKNGPYLVLALVLVVLDQVTKNVVARTVDLYESVPCPSCAIYRAAFPHWLCC